MSYEVQPFFGNNHSNESKFAAVSPSENTTTIINNNIKTNTLASQAINNPSTNSSNLNTVQGIPSKTNTLIAQAINNPSNTNSEPLQNNFSEINASIPQQQSDENDDNNENIFDPTNLIKKLRSEKQYNPENLQPFLKEYNKLLNQYKALGTLQIEVGNQVEEAKKAFGSMTL